MWFNLFSLCYKPSLWASYNFRNVIAYKYMFVSALPLCTHTHTHTHLNIHLHMLPFKKYFLWVYSNIPYLDKTYQDRLLKTVFHCCCGPIIDLNSECVDGILCWQSILLEILYHDKDKYFAIINFIAYIEVIWNQTFENFSDQSFYT